MANRDITQFRQVIGEVQKSPNQLAEFAADLGKKIIIEGQQAKINENFSSAQLDLSRLNQQYQTEFAGNPFEGLDQLKVDRKKILDRYGKEISPLFRGKWNSSTKSIQQKEEATAEIWAYSQTKKNTVTSINQSIKNNMSQATSDGIQFGLSATDEIGSMLNYSQSKQQLVEFGDGHLGEQATTGLLENYDEDYLKSFVSGMADSNPLKALRFMEEDQVKNGFRDQKEYQQMKKSVETRALQVDKINAQREVLNTLKDENSLLTESLSQNVPYADLLAEFDRTGMSKNAQGFFLKANGFTQKGTGAVSNENKLKRKSQLYSDMLKLSQTEDLTSKQISSFQDRIYGEMNAKSITQKEGLSFINQLVEPLIEQKEASFSSYSDDSFFRPDIGFGGVQEIFDDEIEIKPSEGEDEVGILSKTINSANKVKLYDFYMASLEEGAGAYGVAMGNINQLNERQQRLLYSEAQKEAVNMFRIDQTPVLSTLPDIPNQTLKSGQLIQGAAGKRDLKPDFAATQNFVILEKDGHTARRYEDGRIEVIK